MQTNFMYFIEQQCKFVTKYKVCKELGTGGFSKNVSECEERETGIKYAAKIIDKLDGNISEVCKEELLILRRVHHENIIRFIDSYETINNLIIITELVHGKSLFEIIQKPIMLFHEDDSRFVMYRLLSALSYLHKNHIVHRDIHPGNIMIKFNDYNKMIGLKLIDFGFASASLFIMGRMGVEFYIAPEMEFLNYDSKVDIYSAGIVLFVMLVHLYYDYEQIFCTKSRILNRDLLDFLTHVSYGAQSLVFNMIMVDPEYRYSATEAFNHKWIQSKENFR